MVRHCGSFFFFFNDTATTEIYTLSLHDALPIWLFAMLHSWDWLPLLQRRPLWDALLLAFSLGGLLMSATGVLIRSEEHTSELQSQSNLVCRLLLEKKKQHKHTAHSEQTERHAHA